MKLKIFIGRWFDNDKNYSSSHTKTAYIVAKSYKQAQELSRLGYSELKNYFACAPVGKLGNEYVQKTCTEIGVWIQDEPWSAKSLRRIK